MVLLLTSPEPGAAHVWPEGAAVRVVDAPADTDNWAAFGVSSAVERLSLLRRLRDGHTDIQLQAAGGQTLTSRLWAIDDRQRRLTLSADADSPNLQPLLEARSAQAWALLDNVKLLFELSHLVLVRGSTSTTLHADLPQQLHRLQRRQAFRLATEPPRTPVALLRHPALPDMLLSLRVLDISADGCALWQPADVPALQPGTHLNDVTVVLDAATRFKAALKLMHVSVLGSAHGTDALPCASERTGARLGCEWQPQGLAAQCTLQRWIDQAQKRQRLLGRT